jgi:hypothetical protein
MSAWKQFLASDIIVTPFGVNKSFSFPSSEFSSSTSGQPVGIERYLGKNTNWFTDQTLTGNTSPEYESLVYSSVKQLYYSNYLTSETGDRVARPVLVPGSNPSGDVYQGAVKSPLYDNFLQSTLTPTRFFPTSSDSIVGVISIPSKIFGQTIQPGSFRLTSGSWSLVDDSQGNIIIENTSVNFGNIIYPQGMVILTNSASYALGQGGGEVSSVLGYGEVVYGTAVYGGTSTGLTLPGIQGFINNGVTCSFSSSMTIYETQYKCTIRESEFTATLNPSARDSNGNLKDNVTGSYFSPYVTTVGLYDEAQNLLAIGKLAQPLPTSDTTDTTILVNLDR